jgi:WhiB family redox-sensing transcriptional regulator
MSTPASVLAVDDTPWRDQASCHRETATVFFPPPHYEMKPEKDERESQARALCRACPVQQDCLEYALDVRETHGIWGGYNELERRRMLRQRQRTA